MKRMIYGVGFFLATLFLLAGFLLSYQVTDLRDRLYALEESSQEAKQQVSALADAKGQNLVFERYDDGKLVREQYKITAYGTQRVVLRQELTGEETYEDDTAFQLKTEDGYVVVYKKDTEEVFEYTDIPFETLPEKLQAEVLLGKTVENLDDLYNFLENYSS